MMHYLSFERIGYEDLEVLKRLQPEGWTDIRPDFEFYTRSGFCIPLKAVLDNNIVGVGALIVYGTTGWLAHIIVDPGHRNQGIGSALTRELLSRSARLKLKTCLLIATEAGLPVYARAGFIAVGEYNFYNREKPWQSRVNPDKIVDYKEEYRRAILKLDIIVSGEDRRRLLEDYLISSRVYIEDGIVLGCFIPGLREGLIIAENEDAGKALMEYKYASSGRAVLPAANLAGNEFLTNNGFVMISTKGTRMIRGCEVAWKPEKIFSRIGGNFG